MCNDLVSSTIIGSLFALLLGCIGLAVYHDLKQNEQILKATSCEQIIAITGGNRSALAALCAGKK